MIYDAFFTYLRNLAGGLGGSFCEMSVSWSPKSGRVDPGSGQKALVWRLTTWKIDPNCAAGGSESTLDPRHPQGKGRFTLKLSDVGSFDGISTGISDDFQVARLQNRGVLAH